MTPYTIYTTCERELWSGFFGIDEFGTQPECNQVIEILIDDDEELEIDEDGTIRPVYSVECPRCKGSLDWPQAWYKTK